MSYTYTTNQTPATWATAMWNLIVLLKSVGWTQQDSSDGSTRSTNQVTGANSGANGLNNNTAWVRLQDPATTQEITLQRGTATYTWRIKYSKSAKFTGGSPSATVTPSATDEVIIIGSGTDASPGYLQIFANTEGNWRAQYMASNTAPYGFYMICYPSGGGAVKMCLMMDPVTGDSSDTNQVVWVRGGNSDESLAVTSGGLSNSAAAGTTGGVFAFLGTTWVACPALVPVDKDLSATIATSFAMINLGTNAFSLKDDGIPVMYGRRAALGGNAGFKGISTFMRWNSVIRSTGDTVSQTTSKDWIIATHVRLPWNGSTPLV